MYSHKSGRGMSRSEPEAAAAGDLFRDQIFCLQQENVLEFWCLFSDANALLQKELNYLGDGMNLNTWTFHGENLNPQIVDLQ